MVDIPSTAIDFSVRDDRAINQTMLRLPAASYPEPVTVVVAALRIQPKPVGQKLHRKS